jgi:hypothetical protein
MVWETGVLRGFERPGQNRPERSVMAPHSAKRAGVNVFVSSHAKRLVECASRLLIRSREFSSRTKNSELLQRFVGKQLVFFNFTFRGHWI